MTTLQNLFNNMNDDEELSDESTAIMIANLDQQVYAGAQGVGIDRLASDRVRLFLRILDTSKSMDDHMLDTDNNIYRPISEVVIETGNELIDALAHSAAKEEFLTSTWQFSNNPLLMHSFVPLEDIPALNCQNYVPCGMTALYNTTLDGITATAAYAKDLLKQGMMVEIIVAVFTDGANNIGGTTAGQLRQVVGDLLKLENWTFSLVGFGCDALAIATEMGFPARNVLTAESTPSEMRRAVNTFSDSMIRKSQGLLNPGGFLS